jgi:hypothetical protein
MREATEESEEALPLLKNPKLLEHILADFAHCGVVGEETNRLIGYLAATARKRESPLAVMVQSSSAAGKSSLMEAVLAFMPEEDKVQYSAMTGQSLFCMGAMDLKHKILALAEEEGAAPASYALKVLQSEGTLSIASTAKDPESGKLVTQEYRVEGPVMIFSTTTQACNASGCSGWTNAGNTTTVVCKPPSGGALHKPATGAGQPDLGCQ